MEFIEILFHVLPPSNQNPGAATGTSTLCTACYTKITLLNNLKLTVLLLDFGFLHKFYAHTKYAIMKTYFFRGETIKNNHYTSFFNEFNLHKCIIVAYFLK